MKMALKIRYGEDVYIWASSKNLLYKDFGYVCHHFYNPFVRNDIVIHPWEIFIPVLIGRASPSRYFFSAYKSGNIVEIDKDPRFSTLYKSYFGNRPWVECYFTGLDQLTVFMRNIVTLCV